MESWEEKNLSLLVIQGKYGSFRADTEHLVVYCKSEIFYGEKNERL